MSLYEKLLHDLDNDPKVAKEVALGRRVRLYRVREQLGSGNFSKVKLGIHVLTKEKVAIKIIDKTSLDDRARKVLSREIMCMERLSHPNLIRLYEVVESVQKMHIIMEYAPGGELCYRIINGGPCSEVDAKPIFFQVASAIHYMHNVQVVHRDLKAENVFFARSGAVKVGDFGFSIISHQNQYLDTFCGSPPYAAPELFKDEQYLGPPVDVWAMGVLLIFVVTGKLPFIGSTVQELKELVLSSSFEIPSSLSEDINDLIKGLLVHNPLERYSVSEVFKTSWVSSYSVSVCDNLKSNISTEDHKEEIMQEVMAKLVSLNIPIDNVEALKDLHDAAGGVYNIVYHQVENQEALNGRPDEAMHIHRVHMHDSAKAVPRADPPRQRSSFCSFL